MCRPIGLRKTPCRINRVSVEKGVILGGGLAGCKQIVALKEKFWGLASDFFWGRGRILLTGGLDLLQFQEADSRVAELLEYRNRPVW